MWPFDVVGDEAEAASPSEDPAPYLNAFGLGRAPFDQRPNPRFLHETGRNRHALHFVELALKQLSPVTLLMGAPGVGKTILVRHMINSLVRGLRVGVLPPPARGREDLFGRLLGAFDQPRASTPDESRARFARSVAEAFEGGDATLLVVEDAHQASEADLVALRDLTAVPARLGNQRSAFGSPLILLLVGWPELRERLETPSLRPLAGRLEAATTLFRLTRSDTAGYVRHRVGVAGGSARLFRDDALEAVHDRTDGVPRAINALCDACLAAAAHEGRTRIDAELVASIADPPASSSQAAAPDVTAETAGVVRLREETRHQEDPSPDLVPAPPPARPGTAARAGTATDARAIERLRALPGVLALVPLGVGSQAEGTAPPDLVLDALDLARACAAASREPTVAFAGGATCLVEPTRAFAACGADGLNLGLVLRLLRDLPEADAPARSTPAPAPAPASAPFGTPWRDALWRLAEVVDRTVSPRRVLVETGEGPVAAHLSGGRIEVADGLSPAVLGARLRGAASAGRRARFRLEPAAPEPDGWGRGATAAEFLAEAAGMGRDEPPAPLRLDQGGWPVTLPAGLDLGALSHAVAVARRLAASDGARGGPPRVAALGRGGLRTVARVVADEQVEIDHDWLARLVAGGVSGPAGGRR